VLAARLSEASDRRVLLLEAGPDDQSLPRRILAGKSQMTGDPRFDWHYTTEPDPNMADRPRIWPRGKVLGGSSTINGLIAIRGQPEDYDGWAALGCEGWAWRDVLPCFRRLEDADRGHSPMHDPELRGAGGPMPVRRFGRQHFLCDQFIAAARQELGVSENQDFNGPSQEGIGYLPMNIRTGLLPRRVSAAAAYLAPARRRANLRVITDAHVARIRFDGRRASGVEFRSGTMQAVETARVAVILCAGSIGSPQILQLSGIGDPEHLRALGIEMVAAIPEVGENLQDHLQIPSLFQFRCRGLGQSMRNVIHRFQIAVEGMMMQTSLYYGAMHLGMFVRSRSSLHRPDLQLQVHPAGASLRLRGGLSSLTISGWQLRPESRGRLRIRSADSMEKPTIEPRYLSAPADQQMAVDVLRIARKLAMSDALQRFRIEQIQPHPSLTTDEALLDVARSVSETGYHPVGTCRMGADTDSVVDPRLRVRGVEGLYVADASIMPTLTSGNTNLPSIMIGERAAEIIRADVEAARPAP
jgi:choline dehydrogenase